MLRDTMTKTFNGELAEGIHEVLMHSWEYMAHQTDPEKDYILVTLKHDKGNYKRNLFDKDVQIMISHLRRQLGREQETVIPQDFFKELIDSKTKFNIWVSYPTVLTQKGPKRVQNINFLEPIATPAEDNATPDMEVPPFTP